VAAKILTMKMEEAIRLKTQQERFMDMISHEIRNPLSAVLHCGEEVVEAMKKSEVHILALDGAASSTHNGNEALMRSFKRNMDSALDAANTIMYCVQHQKQIVDDVLTLSKLDSDMLVVSPVPVQPATLVPTSLKMFEHELRMTGIELELHQDESLDLLQVDWVLLDPNRFLQIVINLVTNAIKFTKKSTTRSISVSFRASLTPFSPEEMAVDFVPRRYAIAKPSTPSNDTSTTHEDVYIGLSVRDTGKGLSADECALLFGRFAQSPKTHIEYGGSGLGLFISRQITEMLGGRIGMASTIGKGCTFAFFVKAAKTYPLAEASPSKNCIVDPFTQLSALNLAPSPTQPSMFQDEQLLDGLLATADDRQSHGTATGKVQSPVQRAQVTTPESVPASPEPTPIATSSKTLRILVVEDNFINQKVLVKLLRNRGYQVEAASHGQEALSLLLNPSSPSFDVILCDVEMPIMDGLQFTKAVRAMESNGGKGGLEGSRVPIIGVTANVRSQQVRSAMESGMDGVTTKPYRIDELVGHISQVCGMG
jgi:signal transduction histidine kinase